MVGRASFVQILRISSFVCGVFRHSSVCSTFPSGPVCGRHGQIVSSGLSAFLPTSVFCLPKSCPLSIPALLFKCLWMFKPLFLFYYPLRQQVNRTTLSENWIFFCLFSIGKGFQGVMKRWGFKGQPASLKLTAHLGAGESGAPADTHTQKNTSTHRCGQTRMCACMKKKQRYTQRHTNREYLSFQKAIFRSLTALHSLHWLLSVLCFSHHGPPTEQDQPPCTVTQAGIKVLMTTLGFILKYLTFCCLTALKMRILMHF